MNLSVILCSPQLGENIGASARAMMNFGITDLRIVTPRDSWPNQKAIETSKSAVQIINNAQVFTSLEEAISDMQYVYAATARPRDMVKTELSPHQAASVMPLDKKCAVLFGPEKSGLSNEEIVLADAIITIPTSTLYTSLNLAQSVAIIAYEIFMNQNHQKLDDNNQVPASRIELLNMLNHLRDELDIADFFVNVPDKREKMLNNINNIFTRANLTEQEIRTLRGIIRALSSR